MIFKLKKCFLSLGKALTECSSQTVTLIPNLHCKCHHWILNNSIISISITILDSILKHWWKQKMLPKHFCKEKFWKCHLCVENINKSATQSFILRYAINRKTLTSEVSDEFFLDKVCVHLFHLIDVWQTEPPT